MSFDWKEYYELSILLATDQTITGNIQARFRSAISRCYFAAHNLAKDRLIRIDHVNSINPTGEAHRQIIDEFSHHPIDELKEVSVILNRLRIERGKADYRENFGKLRQTVEFVLLQTKTLIDLLDENE